MNIGSKTPKIDIFTHEFFVEIHYLEFFLKYVFELSGPWATCKAKKIEVFGLEFFFQNFFEKFYHIYSEINPMWMKQNISETCFFDRNGW